VLGGLFGSKPTPKNIEKQSAKAQERYAQPEFRRQAMDKLLAWGTPEALDALIKRFSVVVQSPHWDEEEKRWLVEELAERGEVAREGLSRYLRSENNIAYAAKAIRQLTDEAGYQSELIGALQSREPSEYRTAQAKQELIACLEDVEGDAVVEALIPYLDDHADDVQCTCVDVLEHKNATQAHARLIEMLSEDQHSARVLRHIAGAVARMGCELDPEKALEAAVLEDFVVKDGKLERKSAEGSE
jgi:hypothetical protein